MSLIQIQRQYERIPTFTCKEGCTDCCGPVPFTVDEWEQIPPDKRKPLTSHRCQYSGPTGCEIYEVRPLLCRLFGTVKEEGLTCWHGCAPQQKLTAIQGRTMLRHYLKEPLAQDPLHNLVWVDAFMPK